jgi:hypothetical protein
LIGEPGIGKSATLDQNVKEIQLRSISQERCLRFDLRAYGSEQRLQREIFEHPDILTWECDTSTLHLFLDSLDESLLRVDTVTDMIAEAMERFPLARLLLRITHELRNVYGFPSSSPQTE